MIVSIHQPQYLPWLGYFEKIARADVFVILDDVQFKKNEWQNRNRIRTCKNWQWLTVPVLHDSEQKISDVVINNHHNWQVKHLRSLEQNYAKAPFFKTYFPIFEKIYDKNWDKLVDVNMTFILHLVEVLGIRTRIVRSSTCSVSEERTQRLVDLCRLFNATEYLSGQGGEHYLDVEEFKKSGIRVAFQKYEHPVYPQQWCRQKGDFISHLSIVDVLFNTGPNALNILLKQKANL